MHRRFASADRIHSARSEVTRSPYAKNYRTNLTHDQRELLSHRQNVSKLQRRDLEDRYIALMDEHFALKKDNAHNHDKIKKLATKLLRLSADGKHRGASFPMQLSPNENLEIQNVKLESYNALLKDRLNSIIRIFGNGIRSISMSGLRPASCSNLSLKRKFTISQDDLNLLEIPDPPDGINGKSGDNRKCQTKCKCKCSLHHQPQHHHQLSFQSEASVIEESERISNMPEAIIITPATPVEKININDLKNTIQKLENDLLEASTDNKSMQRVNSALEEKLTNEILSKRITENVELIELRRTMVECETELHELRNEYLELRSKTETELDEEQKRINELTAVIKSEIAKSRSLNEELAALKNATNIIETLRDESKNIQEENQLLKDQQNKSSSKQTDENISRLAEKNGELEKMLSDSKRTIVDLRDRLKSTESDLQTLQTQNEHHAEKTQKRSEDTIGKTIKSKATSPDVERRIPLEPQVTILNDHLKEDGKNNASRHGNGDQFESANLRSSKKHPSLTKGNNDTDQNHDVGASSSSSEGGTYNITENNPVEEGSKMAPRKSARATYDCREKRRLMKDDETASDVSSIDSDKNYRTFKRKNRSVKNSLLLLDRNSVPLDFTSRLNTLERAAYHQPLSSSVYSEEGARGLTCSCDHIDCRRRNQSFYQDIKTAVENAKALLLKELQSYPTDANDSQNRSLSFTGLEDTSECREFLRVQYNLYSLYKQELEFMCKSCKEQTETLLNEIDALKERLEKYEVKIQILEDSAPKAGDNTSVHRSLNTVLNVSRGQGCFEIHIESFKLTKEGQSLLSCKHGEPGSLYFSWRFYNLEIDSRTSLQKGPTYGFHSASLYLVDIRGDFLRYIKNKQLEVHLLAEVGGSSIPVGRTLLNVSEVLMFPQNRIQLDTKIVSADGECNSHMNSLKACACHGSSTPRRRHLGNLSLWFRLTCEMDVLKAHAEQFWTENKERGRSTKCSQKRKINVKKPERPQKENRAISDEHGTIEESGSGDEDSSMAEAEGPIRRKDIQARMEMRPLQQNEIAITIGPLVLLADSDIIANPSLQQIYIEYNFIDRNGSHSIETPQSLPKPNPPDTALPFDFRKVFQIEDHGINKRNYVKLSKLLKNHEKNVKFIVVSEPAKDSHRNGEHLECTEIGLGLLHLGKIVAEAEPNSLIKSVQIPIMSKSHPYKNAGYLEVLIEGVNFMKTIATAGL